MLAYMHVIDGVHKDTRKTDIGEYKSKVII